jgi:hypothetical protein
MGSPPPVGTIQTSECLAFPASLMVVTVKATRVPSGDMAGEDTLVRRYQSPGVKARPRVGVVSWAPKAPADRRKAKARR